MINSLTDTTTSGNISAPPMFAAPPRLLDRHLHLNADSACIGAGTKTARPIRDLDGKSRSATNPASAPTNNEEALLARVSESVAPFDLNKCLVTP